MQPAREYNLKELGKRAKCIPGPEPKLTGEAHDKVIGKRARPLFSKNIIPVCEPTLNAKAFIYVKKALKTNWISSRGEFLEKFENLFAKKVGARYAVAVNSGTSALHLALATLGIKAGDEVIVPTYTMISSAFAISYLGAQPVFVDCDDYYQIDSKLIEAAITKKTKAIMPVHIYGHPTDMDKIEAVAKKYKLSVIYDAAESHGAKYKGKQIGGRGSASCYSFYANKIITTGEGGMVVTNNKDFADLARNLKDVAFSTERHFWHKRLGYNFRMTNLTAAIGLAQTEQYDKLVAARIYHAKYYMKNLSAVKGVKFPRTAPWAKNVYWMFGFEVLPEFGMSRDELRKFMAQRGIETRTYFVPLHLQPYYYHENKGKVLPVSEKLSETGLYIPSASNLTKKQQDRVIQVIKQAAKTAQ
ncbi:MAG: DegT/DnrJ/EryC1/StrS family aminotransferase [Candidatus Beckwithbacteria bacterium]|nr:DegT/DnrJ/EryC1/StrS family aminotransferase [Candidatus Beckwithbacteria bacterium]